MSDLMTHQRQLLGIAKSWAEAHLPGWTDECHRDLIARYGAKRRDGRVSAMTMTARQIGEVLTDYARRGWPLRKGFVRRGGSVIPIPPRIAHLVRLWGRLGQAGKLDHATRPALLAYCERQTGHPVKDLDTLTVAESQDIISALKNWLGK